jgi:hypothetical protein
VLCDGCASRCEPCDQACIDHCKTVLAPLLDIEELNRCSPAILECFAPDEPTGHCAALEPCCQVFEGSDDGPLCRGFIDRKQEGACLTLHAFYAQQGVCD